MHRYVQEEQVCDNGELRENEMKACKETGTMTMEGYNIINGEG